MIDAEGYRSNVGIILTDHKNRLFWGKRIGQDAWQFPQGGIQSGETAEATLFRELHEEIGLDQTDVMVLAVSKDWTSYRIPKHMLRYHRQPLCIGQKQKWFLLRLVSPSQKIRLDLTDNPEFDSWCWVNYWYPLRQVIHFKREVYRRVLEEFATVLHIK